MKKRGAGKKEVVEEFEQRMVDIARVTRVMAGGKRMRFRACVAIGDKKGRIGLGMAKGADVSLAVNKAVNNAKKSIIEVPITNDTIPHGITHKFGAAQVLLKPASQGRGVIAGGAIRIILELAGIKNITSKNLGTNNKVTISKCVLEALDLLKKSEVKNVKNEAKSEPVENLKEKTPNKEASPKKEKKEKVVKKAK
jgi:small subunit ribosomal protein S5